ncbi:MAG: GatB/YqeY domain-containing protein [Bacteroidetes bacterium]|nr:GatB/YqeY domain-containing protein [Bacteroidota bacterium]
MNLEEKVMSAMKNAMKQKDEAALRSLRGIKAEIIKAKTEPGAHGEISQDGEMKLLQKMLKQRKDALEIYTAQKREDLANKEKEEIAVIEQYLPAQLSEEEILETIQKIIAQTGASGLADLGKVMGLATKELAGKAEGKTISSLAKNLLAP